MSKSPKISIGYYEELKRQVENISASKIINQALDVGSNLRSNTPEKENERNELAFEIVHNTKETARNTFLSNLNSRKVDKLIKQFTINVDECNDNDHQQDRLLRNVKQRLRHVLRHLVLGKDPPERRTCRHQQQYIRCGSGRLHHDRLDILQMKFMCHYTEDRRI